MADAKVSVEKLDDSNWISWKFRLTLMLMKDNVWDTVIKPRPQTNEPLANASWADKDAKARIAIGLSLENNQLCHVVHTETAFDMWNALKGYHERRSMGNRLHLKKKLYTTRLVENGNMTDHLAAIAMLVNRLKGIGVNVEDYDIIAVILSSLPPSYNPVITALECRGDDKLTVEMVKGQLFDEWRRRNDNECDNMLPEKVMKMSFKPKKSVNPKCHFCEQEGHFVRHCPKLSELKKKSSVEQNTQPNAKLCQEDKDEDQFCFAAGDVESDNKWYLDSGASAHMTNNVDNLFSLEKASGGSVCLADGKKIPARGSGSSKLEVLNESDQSKSVTLKRVLLVPELASNLVSIARIADEGFDVLFTRSDCKLLKNGKPVLLGERKGGLYYLKQPQYQSMLSSVCHSDRCLHLWHRRLGHRHQDAVKRIEAEKLGDDLKLRDCGVRSVCTVCCEAKLARKPFPDSSSKSSAVLELIHTDLAGPLEVNTPGGKRFIMTMIDDYSKYTVVYLLGHKSEAADKIKEYVSLVQNKFDRRPQILRSDGGGEYNSKALQTFLSENGIVLQQTAPYSPQQNGQAERKNRTLLEMSRCLLLEGGLDKKYWGEAVMTANYLLNRLPSASIDRTPYEHWHGTKPTYNHLRVFGSMAYVHIPDQKRQKLDPKAIPLVFVGYQENRKAYRFLNPETSRIVVSRDALFLEMELKPQESVRSFRKPQQTEMCTEANEDHWLQEEPEPSCTIVAPDEDLEAVIVPELEDDSAAEVLGETSSDSPFRGFRPEEYLRRSQRTTKGTLPARYRDQANAVWTEIDAEPRNLQEARTSTDAVEWQAAMESELKSHQENQTWELVRLPEGRKAVGSRWVFKVKRDAAGVPVRHKARLVAQGFSQQFGVDFEEVYAPVANQSTFRALVAIASKENIALKHLDVRTAYLHGDLKEEVFMRQPPGFVEPGQEHFVCRLKKSIYGLKQSARCWNQKLQEVLVRMGFKPGQADACLYTKSVGTCTNTVYVLVYVDDIVVGCKDDAASENVYNELKRSFDIVHLGDLSYFLGMQIERRNGTYSISLGGYITQLADRFGLKDAKPAKSPMDSGFLQLEDRGSPIDGTLYRSLVGALMYIGVHARPDIAASTSILGRRVSDPREADWTAAKRTVRYLIGTKHHGLHFTGEAGDLTGYCDADWAGDHESRKSTSGFCFLLGGAAICWASRRQTAVTLSSMEAEHTALSEACQEVIWLRKLMLDFNFAQNKGTVIYEDNQSCLAFVNSERSTRRSKHIDTREHFIRNLCEHGEVQLTYCPSEDMIADILTKPLGAVKQRILSEKIGLFRRAVPEEEC